MKKTQKTVPYPYDYFRIQLEFALKAWQIMEIPIEGALLLYTSFYKRIGNKDWKHDPDSPKWREYAKGIRDGKNPADLAYSMYLKNSESKNPEANPDSCFSYEYLRDEKTVYIHFQNNFASGGSPLSRANMPLRRKELVNIFREIKTKHPKAETVAGASWIYAYDAYTRLFPPEYTTNMQESPGGLRGNGVWGQFVNSEGKINGQRAEQFLENVRHAKTEEELLNSFPIKSYKTRAPIEAFYKFLGIY